MFANCEILNSAFVCGEYYTDTIDYTIVIDQLSPQFFFPLGRLKDELKFLSSHHVVVSLATGPFNRRSSAGIQKDSYLFGDSKHFWSYMLGAWDILLLFHNFTSLNLNETSVRPA